VSVPADTNAVVIARGGIGYRERRAEIARLRRSGGPPASSPPSLTYRMHESSAQLAARVRDAEIAQRLAHFRLASRNYHGEWFPTWQERQAEIARLRGQP
jgi:hypothetical protein